MSIEEANKCNSLILVVRSMIEEYIQTAVVHVNKLFFTSYPCYSSEDFDEFEDLAGSLNYFINVMSSDENDRNEIWMYLAPHILPPKNSNCAFISF